MNVVKIMGGLGNQLFQYAFAQSLKKYDEIGFDATYYDSHFNNSPDIAHREFLLPCFVDDLKYSTEDGLTRVNQWEYDQNKPYYNSFFFGDWQKVSFFKDIELGIKLKDEFISDYAREIAAKMQKQNSVSIHVRRTDYIKLGWVLEDDYYTRAIETIRGKFEEACTFYVFSDEATPYLFEKMPLNVFYICGDTLNDFWLMSQCKHHIIANSTFSFWPAYLNKNPDKIVIYPKDWKCPSPIDTSIERWFAV